MPPAFTGAQIRKILRKKCRDYTIILLFFFGIGCACHCFAVNIIGIIRQRLCAGPLDRFDDRSFEDAQLLRRKVFDRRSSAAISSGELKI